MQPLAQFRAVAAEATGVADALRALPEREPISEEAGNALRTLSAHLDGARDAFVHGPKSAVGGGDSQANAIADLVRSTMPDAKVSVTRSTPGGLDIPSPIGKTALQVLADDALSLRRLGKAPAGTVWAGTAAARAEQVANHAARAALLIEQPPFEVMTEAGRDAVRGAYVAGQRDLAIVEPFEEAVQRDLLAQRNFSHVVAGRDAEEAIRARAGLIAGGRKEEYADPLFAEVEDVLVGAAKDAAVDVRAEVAAVKDATASIATRSWADSALAKLPPAADLPEEFTTEESLHRLATHLVETAGAKEEVAFGIEHLGSDETSVARKAALAEVGKLADERAAQLREYMRELLAEG
jgi:hypothetical protein